MTTEERLVDESVDENVEVDERAGKDSQEPADEIPAQKHGLTQWVSGLRPRHGAILIAGLVVAAAGLAGWAYGYQYRPDQQSDDPAAQTAMRAAADGTAALLTYGPDSVNQDFASAKKHLTGDFLSYYSKFTEKVVAPAAKGKGVKTTASVVQAAVSEIHPDSAVVLLFVNQATTSKDRPEPSLTASSVVVRLAKIDGQWLIAKFDPV
jgi:Mce-associated membrane protein